MFKIAVGQGYHAGVRLCPTVLVQLISCCQSQIDLIDDNLVLAA